jgi:hypothetical protein
MKKYIEEIKHIATLDDVGKQDLSKELNKIKYTYKSTPVFDIRMWERRNPNLFDPKIDLPRENGLYLTKEDVLILVDKIFSSKEIKNIMKIKEKNNKIDINKINLKEWNEIKNKDMMIFYSIKIYMIFNEINEWEAEIGDIESETVEFISDLYNKPIEKIRSYSKWFGVRWLGRKFSENKELIKNKLGLDITKHNKIYKIKII